MEEILRRSGEDWVDNCRIWEKIRAAERGTVRMQATVRSNHTSNANKIRSKYMISYAINRFIKQEEVEMLAGEKKKRNNKKRAAGGNASFPTFPLSVVGQIEMARGNVDSNAGDWCP